MGTTVSIDVREPFTSDEALDEAIAWFHDVDRRFSPYRDDSEVTRVGDGRLDLEDASPDVRAMFTLADEVRDRSGGAFDARRHRPDGRPDPTGVVKGWPASSSASSPVATLETSLSGRNGENRRSTSWNQATASSIAAGSTNGARTSIETTVPITGSTRTCRAGRAVATVRSRRCPAPPGATARRRRWCRSPRRRRRWQRSGR